MAPIFSTLFGFLVGTETGAHNVYTVPAGFVAILRDIDLLSNSSGAAQIFVQATLDAGAWLQYTSSAEFSVFQWRGRQVYPAGHSIAVLIASGAWIGRFSGYLLTD